jgi:hypothetical protein
MRPNSRWAAIQRDSRWLAADLPALEARGFTMAPSGSLADTMAGSGADNSSDGPVQQYPNKTRNEVVFDNFMESRWAATCVCN